MITVVISVMNSWEYKFAFHSLLRQSLLPDRVVFTDGGSSEDYIQYLETALKKRNFPFDVEIVVFPGTCSETRKQYLKSIKVKDDDIIAFLDSDEVAPREWLKELTFPILNQESDFTGGPTKPLKDPKNRCEDFINYYDDWYYKNIVSKDIRALPMGNSAWSGRVLKEVGELHDFRDSEDMDFNIRAIEKGFRGKLVKTAWVYHNQQNLDTLWKIFKKKYTYSSGSTFVFLNNRKMGGKTVSNAMSTVMCWHPIEFMNFIAKMFGFIRGVIDWKKSQSMI